MINRRAAQRKRFSRRRFPHIQENGVCHHLPIGHFAKDAHP
jgi:hypothetical protein